MSKTGNLFVTKWHSFSMCLMTAATLRTQSVELYSLSLQDFGKQIKLAIVSSVVLVCFLSQKSRERGYPNHFLKSCIDCVRSSAEVVLDEAVDIENRGNTILVPFKLPYFDRDEKIGLSRILCKHLDLLGLAQGQVGKNTFGLTSGSSFRTCPNQICFVPDTRSFYRVMCAA